MATLSVKIIDKLGDNTRGLLRVVKYPSGKVRVSGIELNQKFIEDTPEKTKETLVHEIQHAVQEYENFARGGSLEGAGGFNNYYRLGGEQEARETAERARSYTKSKHRIDELSRQLDLKKKVSPACAGMIPDHTAPCEPHPRRGHTGRLSLCPCAQCGLRRRVPAHARRFPRASRGHP